MKMQAGWVVGVAMAWLWAAPAGARDVSDALKLVPRDAVAFGLVNHIDQTFQRIEDVGKKFVSEPFSFRELLRKETGIDKGLDKMGDLVIVLFSAAGAKEKDQVSVYCVPVLDYKDFLQGLKPGEAREGVREITLANGTKLLAANKGHYALLARPDHVAALKKVLAADQGFAPPRPLRDWLTETSYSLVLTPRGLKEAQAEWRKGLEDAQKKLGPSEAIFVQPLLDGLSRFLQSDEVSHFGVGALLDPAGNVYFRFKALFKEDGAFARGVGKVKAAPGGPLAHLPGGPYVVALGGPTPDDLLKELIDLKMQVLKATAANPDADTIREVEKASKELTRGIEGLGLRLGTVKEGEPLFASLIGVLRVKDGAAFLADFEKTIKAVRAVVGNLKSPLVSGLEVRKFKVGGRSALEITSQVGGGLGEVEKKVLETLFGPEGKLTVTLLAADDRTLLFGYRPAGEFQKLLPKETDRGLANDPQVLKTVKLLLAGAQWVLLVNPQAETELLNRFLKIRDGKQFPTTPPLGIALRLSAAGADLEMVMPAALVESFNRLVSPPPGSRPIKESPPREKGD